LNDSSLLLTCPKDLAVELIESEVAELYIRETRTDPTLLTAIVVAGSTAGTTVIITSFTKGVVERLAGKLGAWFHRQGSDTQVQIVVQSDGKTVTKTIKITATASESELIRLMELTSMVTEKESSDDE
jgi:hypothetical protein